MQQEKIIHRNYRCALLACLILITAVFSSVQHVQAQQRLHDVSMLLNKQKHTSLKTPVIQARTLKNSLQVKPVILYFPQQQREESRELTYLTYSIVRAAP
ncbi:hypothetical protein [Psittacicella gerlachiana]|uniref:Uncharacterized protein n=1 Tax=Psittacicella gerlachiana TaxID=2028574 RepID=A0A3A1YLM7_9GAMM|nr:hypothetical protein [Psittacicella gerlachiana]RIY38565.1 hypothetical protein CKF59_00570 [Psittacicella gerlachiana]